MKFLRVLLSQNSPLDQFEEYYHKILSFDASESIDTIETYLKNHSLISLYDEILIPILYQIEIDYHHELIDMEKKQEVHQRLFEIMEYFKKDLDNKTKETISKVLFIPLQNSRDIICNQMLADIYSENSSNFKVVAKQKMPDTLNEVREEKPFVVCLTAIAPFSLSHLLKMINAIKKITPQQELIVLLCKTVESNRSELLEQLKQAGVSKVAFTLASTLSQLEEIKKN